MPKRLTQQGFIDRAKERHGIAYSFAKTVYTHSHEDVTVTCPKHGDWQMRASQLIRRNGANGCPSCAGRTERTTHKRGTECETTETWVAKAKEVHGNTYDYSTVDYKHSLRRISVTCKLHGPFAVTPGNHINRKSGCPVCAGRLRKDPRIFIVRAKTIHGTKYDYHLVQPFLTTKDKATIVCPTHGKFEQRIQAHLNGQGCQKCGIETTANKTRGVKKRKMKVVTL